MILPISRLSKVRYRWPSISTQIQRADCPVPFSIRDFSIHGFGYGGVGCPGGGVSQNKSPIDTKGKL